MYKDCCKVFTKGGFYLGASPPVPRRKALRDVRSIPLPDNWEEIRASVIERDKACRDCGDKGNGVHHVDKDRRHNDMDNLIYLCWPCHRRRHHHPPWPQPEFNLTMPPRGIRSGKCLYIRARGYSFLPSCSS